MKTFFEGELVDAVLSLEVVAKNGYLIVLEYSASLALRPIIALHRRRMSLIYRLVLKLIILSWRKALPKRCIAR